MSLWPNISDFPLRRKVHSVRWWTVAPSIVAESLQTVSDPLQTALHSGQPASGRAVACALARSLAPEEASDPVASWLQPEQIISFRRTLAALRQHRGAILADRVGSGKTYIALAVAAALNRRPTACLVPAVLLGQWKNTAARLGIAVSLCSHEQVSRGTLPGRTGSLVIIDESHHFRNPRTRRYHHVSAWLAGRAALMVTATPIVNRPTDLSNQLLLSVRDDALLLDGIISLRALLTRAGTHSALGQLVIECNTGQQGRPQAVQRISIPTERENDASRTLVERLNQLRLSRSESVATLVRGILLRAGASSPAALAGALVRYRALLLHAEDAFRSGGVISRSEIRRFTAALSDQLLWWELMTPIESECDLDLSDLEWLDELIQMAAETGSGDDKLERLARILSDGIPTLVFTGFRDTVRYLCDHLGSPSLAWCTGQRAGIGRMPMGRTAVLDWFRGNKRSSLAPQHLIVTDVAAEGLDLQRAGRVVHYDLPWTPMRVQQREGRSLRCGSQYREVDVVRFSLPPKIERLLGLERTLVTKGRMPAAMGLGAGGSRIWRWRSELAARFAEAKVGVGTAQVVSPREGMLAGFELHGGRDHWRSRTVIWLEGDGSWSEAPGIIEEWLDCAASHTEVIAVGMTQLSKWLALLSCAIKDRISRAASSRWSAAEPTAAVRELAARLQIMSGIAARKHQPNFLAKLDNAMTFVTRGHTAGEAAIIQRMARLTDTELEKNLSRLGGAGSDWAPIEARLTGLILFGPASAPTHGR